MSDCRRCRDTGIVSAPGKAGGTTVGAGERYCTCAAADQARACALVLDLYYSDEIRLTGNGTRATEIVMRHLARLRDELQEGL